MPPGGAVEEVSIEAILQPQQYLSRLVPFPAPDDVAKIVESLDARRRDNQRFSRRTAMRGERMRHPRRHHQQIPAPRDDDILPGQQVERTIQDVEQLGGMIVPVRHRAIGTAAERDPVAAQRPRGRTAIGGLGISILPPASVRAVTAHVAIIPLTPPLRRDICAVTAATRPPAGPAQALLTILQADISR